MVFQDGVLLPHRNVLDNVALACARTARRDRRAIARTWLERVGATELSERRPGSLSGGQRQRVALARALAGEPAIVLLDEPLSALDAAVRHELGQLIRDLITSSGVPALLVTHDVKRPTTWATPSSCISTVASPNVDWSCARRARSSTGRDHGARIDVSALVPHSWLNDLGIPPWVWNPLSISLRAALEATIIVAITGITLGYVLAKGRFPGRGVIETVCSLPMALPPTVVGYFLLTRLGGPGPFRTLEVHLFGHPLTFTFTGIVIAQVVESFPYCVRFSRAAIHVVDPRFEQAARTMGLSRPRTAFLVTLPLARRGIVAGVALAFGRALGDFGATMIVSGSVPMATTMPIALYNAVFFGSHQQAMVLALIQLGVAFAILLGVSRLGKVRPW